MGPAKSDSWLSALLQRIPCSVSHHGALSFPSHTSVSRLLNSRSIISITRSSLIALDCTTAASSTGVSFRDPCHRQRAIDAGPRDPVPTSCRKAQKEGLAPSPPFVAVCGFKSQRPSLALAASPPLASFHPSFKYLRHACCRPLCCIAAYRRYSWPCRVAF